MNHQDGSFWTLQKVNAELLHWSRR